MSDDKNQQASGEQALDDTINPSLIDNEPSEDLAAPVDDEPRDQENTMQSIEGEEPLFEPAEAPQDDVSATTMAPPSQE